MPVAEKRMRFQPREPAETPAWNGAPPLTEAFRAATDIEAIVQERVEGGILYSLEETQKAYLAGIFDGEGCCSVEREVRKDRGGKVRFRIVISVSNTDKRVCELMRAQTGHGFIAEVRRNLEKHPEAEFWKTLWQWKLKGGSARFILETMRPYLQIKAPQADLVMREGPTEASWITVKQLNQRGLPLERVE